MQRLKNCDISRREMTCDRSSEPIAIQQTLRKENKEEHWIAADEKNLTQA